MSLQAGTRSATLLDRLATKRTSLMAQAAQQVTALLTRTLAGVLSAQDFTQQASRVERSVFVGFARLASAAYRRVLEESGTTGQPIDLPQLEHVVDWQEVRDEAASRVADGEDVAAVAADLADTVAADLDDAIDSMQSKVRGKIYERAAVNGWRRIVHPELSEGGACGLCIVASTQIYHTPHLKPIHDNCHCEVLPITAAGDPGDSLNRLELGELYSAAANATDAAGLKRVRVQGGQIVARRHPRGQAAKEAAAKVRSIRGFDDPRWIRQQIAITESLAASKWRTSQLKRLRQRLAELERTA